MMCGFWLRGSAISRTGRQRGRMHLPSVGVVCLEKRVRHMQNPKVDEESIPLNSLTKLSSSAILFLNLVVSSIVGSSL